MDRLKDRVKELVEDHKLKIMLALLAVIGILMVALFIMIGQHSDSQNTEDPTTQNFKSQKTRPSSGLASQHQSQFQSTFIDIEGAVKRPGVYQFTNNMRVDDAVNLAGGLNRSADRKHINLAKKLTDQQTVYIPIKGEIKGLPSSDNEDRKASDSSGSNSTGSGKIDLNSANAKQLESINGIGNKRAGKIVDYRKSHGNFKQISDLKNVSGIGDKFLSNIKGHVTV